MHQWQEGRCHSFAGIKWCRGRGRNNRQRAFDLKSYRHKIEDERALFLSHRQDKRTQSRQGNRAQPSRLWCECDQGIRDAPRQCRGFQNLGV